ncbi:hypothetical protein BHM03_00034345 [Ensete ventricosum]|nr:hypothetical protein BHM03_00034345 [Ensete ventricosum]
MIIPQGKLDPVVGRQDQIERVTQILGRRTKNNPCLIGEPGVGKTAIAEGLAQRIANGDVPETIEGKKVCRFFLSDVLVMFAVVFKVITLDMGLLVAGTKYRGEFEERLKKLMEEIKQSDEVILFIDEVHTLIGAGAAEGSSITCRGDRTTCLLRWPNRGIRPLRWKPSLLRWKCLCVSFGLVCFILYQHED